MASGLELLIAAANIFVISILTPKPLPTYLPTYLPT